MTNAPETIAGHCLLRLGSGARKGLARGLAALLAALTVPAMGVAHTQASTVAVDGGRISGVALDSGVQAYLGVPYAAPPVRELRWRQPQPVPAWREVFHADRFGPQCMQPQRDATANQYAGAEITSEDCLYLNVWAKRGLSRAPVIVYLHGGAFFIGAGSAPLYHGESVAQQGAVFVNLNYRLGVLGFLAHPELARETPARSSGNYGFLDQIAALQWVQRNVSKFGGDPGKVTIVGQSAGSMSVLVLQASPLAKGLFSRAVGMSGALIDNAGPMALRNLPVAEADGLRYQAQVNAKSLEDLRRMPADRLVASRAPGAAPIGPIQDGQVLPASIASIFAHGQQNDVPLLLGFTRDESFGGLGPVGSLNDYLAKAQERFGARAAEFLRLYPAQTDAQATEQARLADRDATMARHMKAWASAQAEHGRAAVYSYLFARPHSYASGVIFSDLNPATAGAYHTSEVPFWFGTLDAFNRFRTTRNWSQDDRRMSASMVQALVAFARSGNPVTASLAFPRFNAADPKLLELEYPARVEPWPEQRKFDFFSQSEAASPASVAAPAPPAARD